MAPAASSTSLAGFAVAFAGVHTAFDDFKNKKIADIKKLITECGGLHVSKLSDGCTHLVASQEQYIKRTAKVKDAVNYPDVKIVDFDWLNESFTSNARVDEDGHLLDPNQGTNTTSTSAPVQNSAPVNGKKRQRNNEDDSSSVVEVSSPTSKKKRVQERDGQMAKSRSVAIPVNEHFTGEQNYKVYIDDENMIWDATLNQTNSGNNNNKFYRIQVLVSPSDHYICFTHWGRVGNKGQTKELGDGSVESALANFHDKFKDKNGGLWKDRHQTRKAGKYTFLEMSYDDTSNEDDDELPGAGKRRASKESLESTQSQEVESKLSGPVQRLMKLIFDLQAFDDTLASLEYDSEKMPLGKMSKRTLLRGYEVLKELATLVQSQSTVTEEWVRSVEDLSNQYWSLIPHAFGMNRAPVLRDQARIKREVELLEVLTDMQLGHEIMKTAKANKDKNKEQVNLLDRQYQGLHMSEMSPVDVKSTEFSEIRDYLINSAGSTHRVQYKVQDIFRIQRYGEHDRFAQSEYSKLKNSDRRLLWHGSRTTNFGGILSQGLRIAPPEAPANGYMFGKGVYLADMSTKSAGYCNAYLSGNVALLLLCEAELGKPPLKLASHDYMAGETAKKAGSISTWGVGSTAPSAWKDASCIHKNLKGVTMPDVAQAPGPSGEKDTGLLYNEYIVYDIAQIRLRYLLRVEIK